MHDYSKKKTFSAYSNTINFSQRKSSIEMKGNLVQNYLNVLFPE